MTGKTAPPCAPYPPAAGLFGTVQCGAKQTARQMPPKTTRADNDAVIERRLGNS